VKKQSRVELMRSEFIRVVSIVDKYKQDVSPPTCYSLKKKKWEKKKEIKPITKQIVAI
jgi:propanediol dehydratase large subunit